MAKIRRVRFTVEGAGVFPFDMLRYDSCWPESESRDSYELDRYHEGNPRRQVTLLSDEYHAPTVGRWESFLWRVISQETVR